jgi:5-methylcytosine-specific restriction endonuclease McrA
MNLVFVIAQDKTPLAPCSAWKARKLLAEKKASVYRYFPYTIRLYRVIAQETIVAPKLRLKVDPGATTTGIAIVNDGTGEVIFAAEVEHRGKKVKAAMESRAAQRRGRRGRKTRYRAPRFLNRCKKVRQLPPSLESRVANTTTWVARLRRYCPLYALSYELVKFDTQLMNNAEISGVEYQQGTLRGYEVKEYLLEKWDRACAYCGAADRPLQTEHMIARARGGSDRVSNLCLACEACNQRKGAQAIEEFLARQPALLAKIKAQQKKPLAAAAAMNATRFALLERLQAMGASTAGTLAVETGTGGMTKFNRTQRELPKTHWIDAACVGASTPEALFVEGVRPLLSKAKGHGCRQRCNVDKTGFPVSHAPRKKSFMGFETGDIVRAVVPKGKHKGTHVGRVAIRFRPSFKLLGFDVHPKHVTLVQRADGYSYVS